MTGVGAGLDGTFTWGVAVGGNGPEGAMDAGAEGAAAGRVVGTVVGGIVEPGATGAGLVEATGAVATGAAGAVLVTGPAGVGAGAITLGGAVAGDVVLELATAGEAGADGGTVEWAIIVAAIPTALAAAVTSPGAVEGRGAALSRNAFGCDVGDGLAAGAGAAPLAHARAVVCTSLTRVIQPLPKY